MWVGSGALAWWMGFRACARLRACVRVFAPARVRACLFVVVVV